MKDGPMSKSIPPKGEDVSKKKEKMYQCHNGVEDEKGNNPIQIENHFLKSSLTKNGLSNETNFLRH